MRAEELVDHRDEVVCVHVGTGARKRVVKGEGQEGGKIQIMPFPLDEPGTIYFDKPPESHQGWARSA